MRYLPVLSLTLLLTSCDVEGFIDSQRFKEEFRHVHALKQGGRVTLENYNGSIEISGWAKDEINITGTKYAASEDLLKQVKVDVQVAGDTVNIRTIPPAERKGMSGAQFVIHVPRKVELDRIQSSNGSVRITDVEGPARLRTSNGSVRAFNLSSKLEILTTNGSVEVRGLNGSANLRTSNGTVTLDDIHGSVDATTTNGKIQGQLAESAGEMPMRMQTTNGSIDLRLDSALKTDVRASTTNGSVTIRLPASLNARLDASTTNSSVSCDFPLATTIETSKRKLVGTIGSGGPRIDLNTTNGPIRVHRM